MALEGYRTEQLTEADLKQILGLKRGWKCAAFLKDHGVFSNYTVEDLDRDTAVALEMAQRTKDKRRKQQWRSCI
jgi:hypothetical protein